MKEYDLLAVWFRVADWAAYDLSKNGHEGIVLKPLGIHANAATFIARSAFTSSVYMHRKIGANLLGWIQQPPLSLLGELFQEEVERDSQLEQDDLKRLDSQSVVEDLVFSAAFWMRNIHSRTAAIEFLQTLVERTIAGEYWNTASYAMTVLCQYQTRGCGDLLHRFQRFAATASVKHPCKPSLSQEKEFTESLLANNPETLGTIDSLLDQRLQSANPENLDKNSRDAINQLVWYAERFTPT